MIRAAARALVVVVEARLSSAALLSLLLAPALVACGDAGDPAALAVEEGTSARASDAERIERAIAEDPARAALAHVDASLEADLPVRAATILEEAALPAARQAVAEARALEVTTEEGARLRGGLVSALEARVGALEQEQAALARGMVEDLALADAFRAERLAEEQLVAVAESARAAREAARTSR